MVDLEKRPKMIAFFLQCLKDGNPPEAPGVKQLYDKWLSTRLSRPLPPLPTGGGTRKSKKRKSKKKKYKKRKSKRKTKTRRKSSKKKILEKIKNVGTMSYL